MNLELAPVRPADIHIDLFARHHTVPAHAETAETAEMVSVHFVVPAAVGGVFADLVAEFAAWAPMPMDPRDDGSFHTTIRLAAGQRWRYRFLVDGDRWINDWDARDYVVNGDGCGMSLLRT